MKNLRTATKEDFKVNAVLFTNEGWSFSINEKYDDGLWNTREGKVLFESDAEHYKIEA